MKSSIRRVLAVEVEGSLGGGRSAAAGPPAAYFLVPAFAETDAPWARPHPSTIPSVVCRHAIARVGRDGSDSLADLGFTHECCLQSGLFSASCLCDIRIVILTMDPREAQISNGHTADPPSGHYPLLGASLAVD
ncbi:hypothetical protein BH11ACT7_BH11ACT7_05130 [soil metagenome]